MFFFVINQIYELRFYSHLMSKQSDIYFIHYFVKSINHQTLFILCLRSNHGDGLILFILVSLLLIHYLSFFSLNSTRYLKYYTLLVLKVCYNYSSSNIQKISSIKVGILPIYLLVVFLLPIFQCLCTTLFIACIIQILYGCYCVFDFTVFHRSHT